MNRLQHESSPYLLQHANNPVDWYPWSREALDRARKENKPILVSVGYSSCHWCHVMAHESFEDAAIAAYMNAHFINIKIDREERPDLDQVYMDVCQAITGSGGWPLNCFLLPDGRPFYAGTYFPPMPRHNRPSWLDLLHRINALFTNKQEVVLEQASKLVDMISRSEKAVIEPLLETNSSADQGAREVYEKLSLDFDPQFGGLKGAPKFPQVMTLRFAFDFHLLTGHQPSRKHVLFSLQKMIRGGIYDQLGGGFARYATDQAWLIPHFEKMLYDNALLVGLMADYIRVYPDREISLALRQTLDWLSREMEHPEQGYYSALDADTEGEEGGFYVWTADEIDQLLGTDAELFKANYGVKTEGNWEGRNILWRPNKMEEIAPLFDISVGEAENKIKDAEEILLQTRQKRVSPGLDDKQLLSWNGMMITALTKAAIALDDQAILAKAIQKLHFLMTSFSIGFPRMAHAWKGKPSANEAYLDDYALLIEALIHTYTATGKLDYLGQAADLTHFVLDNFLDEESNLFYFTTEEQTETPIRKKDLYDSAVPAGNSTMCQNLWLLGRYTGISDWTNHSEKMISALRKAITRFPVSFGRWARVMLWQEVPGHEMAIVGPGALEKARLLSKKYAPGSLIMSSEKEVDGFPLLQNRKGTDHSSLVYVCRNFTCQRPVESIEEAQKIIDSMQPFSQKS